MRVFLLLILLMMAEVFASEIILRRVKTRHADACANLGLPDADGATLGEKWLAMTKFIYSGACFRLDDVPLNMLCATVVIGEMVILYAVIFSNVPE